MDCILLIRDKHLSITKSIPIYKGEKNFDTLKIYVPIEYRNTVPVLQIILPDGKTGKIKTCTYENELYNNYYVILVTIVSDLTIYAGDIHLWLTFFGETQELTTKTNVVDVEVLDHSGFSEISIDPDTDIVTAITELQIKVDSLTDSKADSVLYNETDNTLQLLSNGTVLSTCEIPEDVTWSTL